MNEKDYFIIDGYRYTIGKSLPDNKFCLLSSTGYGSVVSSEYLKELISKASKYVVYKEPKHRRKRNDNK